MAQMAQITQITQINVHIAHTAAEMGVPHSGAEEQSGRGAEVNLLCTRAPVLPCSEGWEKLYAERAPWNTLLYGPYLERPPYSTGRVTMAYGRRYGMQVRIARFQNCYGPEGTLQ